MTGSLEGGRDFRRGLPFLLLLALAYGGGVIGYVPLLTLLLPIKIELIAPGDKMGLLSLATLAGAVAASVANIAGGMFSDRAGGRTTGRRPWIWAGLGATLAAYALLHLCRTPSTVIIGVVVFQFALNFMIAPMMALVADEVPDDQKGLVGGLFGAAYPMGSLSAIVVTASPGFGETLQFALVGLMMVATIAPFLLVMRSRGEVVVAPEALQARRSQGVRNLALVWLARLLVQIAGNILFTYLLFYFQSVERAQRGADLVSDLARLSAVVALVTVPVAIGFGRLSDVVGGRKYLLAATTLGLTGGLMLMALSRQWAVAAVGYGLFACACAVFLSLQSTYAMQLLPSPRNRGRDLGLLNLTNTLPALIAPALAFGLVTVGDFRPLMFTLAGLTTLGGILMLMVNEVTDETPKNRSGRMRT